MTTVLRQRIVKAQSLTSLSGLALKLLAFILYLAFKRCHEMNLYFCSLSYSPILLSHPYVLHFEWTLAAQASSLEMGTVISPSGSCDPHRSLTLGPCSHLEFSGEVAALHLSSVMLRGRVIEVRQMASLALMPFSFFLSSLHLSARQREDVCRQSLPESSGLRVDVELTARSESRLI